MPHITLWVLWQLETAGNFQILPLRELGLSATAVHSCLQCSVVSESWKWEVFILSVKLQNKCLMFTITCKFFFCVMHHTLIQHKPDWILGWVSHVNNSTPWHLQNGSAACVWCKHVPESITVKCRKMFSHEHRILTWFQILSGLSVETFKESWRTYQRYVSVCVWATFVDKVWAIH